MALYHKWDVKNGFAHVLTFFSLISDGLGGVSQFLKSGQLNVHVEPETPILNGI